MSANHDVAGLPAHAAGIRAFLATRRPGFAECAPSGRLRLDAIACWLQDVAYADVADAGLDRVAVWVVRRTRIRVNSFPRLGETYELTTFPSGLGRMWAERRTDITLASGSGPPSLTSASNGGPGTAVASGDGHRPPAVQAISLWVHLDPVTWHPVPLTEVELSTYGGDVLDTRISARLRHSAPTDADGGRPWTFRATECDVAGHVNNAAYWEPLEDELLATADPEPESIDVELEYRTPAQPGPKQLLTDGSERRWIVGPEGELHASFALRPPIALGR